MVKFLSGFNTYITQLNCSSSLVTVNFINHIHLLFHPGYVIFIVKQHVFTKTDKIKRRDKNQPIMHQHKVKEGDLVLIHDRVAKTFAPKYKENFRIVKFLGKNQLQLKQTMTEKLQHVHITDVKKASMINRVADQLPDYSSFGRAAKL